MGVDTPRDGVTSSSLRPGRRCVRRALPGAGWLLMIIPFLPPAHARDTAARTSCRCERSAPVSLRHRIKCRMACPSLIVSIRSTPGTSDCPAPTGCVRPTIRVAPRRGPGAGCRSCWRRVSQQQYPPAGFEIRDLKTNRDDNRHADIGDSRKALAGWVLATGYGQDAEPARCIMHRDNPVPLKP